MVELFAAVHSRAHRFAPTIRCRSSTHPPTRSSSHPFTRYCSSSHYTRFARLPTHTRFRSSSILLSFPSPIVPPVCQSRNLCFQFTCIVLLYAPANVFQRYLYVLSCCLLFLLESFLWYQVWSRGHCMHCHLVQPKWTGSASPFKLLDMVG